jgi:Neuraminidase (sialidase)
MILQGNLTIQPGWLLDNTYNNKENIYIKKKTRRNFGHIVVTGDHAWIIENCDQDLPSVVLCSPILEPELTMASQNNVQKEVLSS